MGLGLSLVLGLFRRHAGAGDVAPDGRLITSDGDDFLTSDGMYIIVAG